VRGAPGYRGGGSRIHPLPSPAHLAHYLDYCSEVLSLTSKLAALYLKGFDDHVVIGAVNEIEQLAAGLSRKIWQKIMILDRVALEP
jgi:hypothetical protein